MIKVTMNDKGRVRAIDKDAQPTWIVENTVGGILPKLPKWMLPVVINYQKGTPITKQLQVIPSSGQYWTELNFRQQGKLLELVEWTGGDADQYVHDFESMYPESPAFRNRRL